MHITDFPELTRVQRVTIHHGLIKGLVLQNLSGHLLLTLHCLYLFNPRTNLLECITHPAQAHWLPPEDWSLLYSLNDHPHANARIIRDPPPR